MKVQLINILKRYNFLSNMLLNIRPVYNTCIKACIGFVNQLCLTFNNIEFSKQTGLMKIVYLLSKFIKPNIAHHFT